MLSHRVVLTPYYCVSFTLGLKMWFWVSASVISGIWSIILGLFLASSYMSNTAALDPGFYYVAAQQAAQALKKAQ
jgi:hypothetical protein